MSDDDLNDIRALLPLDEERVEQFEDLVFAYAAKIDPARFADLLRLLTDRDVPFLEIQSSAASAFEAWPAPEYVRGVLGGYGPQSDTFRRTLLRTMLASPSHTDALVGELPKLSAAARASIRSDLERISTASIEAARTRVLFVLT